MTADAPPAIAILAPDGALLDAAGAAYILRLEVEVARALGARPVLYVAAPSLRPFGRPSAAKRAAIAAAAQGLGVELAAIVSPPHRPASLVALARTLARRFGLLPFDVEADLDIGTLATPGRGALSGPAPRAVVANYVSTLGVAERLAPRERQVLVLHDLPSGEPSPRFRKRLQDRAALIAINPVEADRLEALLPEADIRRGVPDPGRPGAALPATASASMADVFAACGPERAYMPEAWAERDHVDLLFVGGSHGPNVEGLRAFVRQCYLPALAPRGVSLAIAGAAGAHVADLVEEASGVALLGRCAELAPLYAHARLVAVPLLRGTGISIKTLEAIGRGKPVLATSVGLRGLPGLADMALPADFTEAWANRIQTLLADPAAAERLARAQSAVSTGPRFSETLETVLRRYLA